MITLLNKILFAITSIFRSHGFIKFSLNIFFQEYFDWMNVSEWLATQCLLWTMKHMFILLEQLTFSLYFVPLFCSFHLCVVLSEFIKWIKGEQQRWLVDFAHVHVMNFWIRHHVELMKNTRSKAIFCVPLRWFLWDNWAICRLFWLILLDWRHFGR